MASVFALQRDRSRVHRELRSDACREMRNQIEIVFISGGVRLNATELTVANPAQCLFILLAYFAGTVIAAPLFFTKNTTNFAGLVLLAFRPRSWTSSGPS